MYCTQCGQGLPEDARFCSQCGAPVHSPESWPDTGQVDHTTSSIDLAAVADDELFPEMPELAPGTGMMVVVRGPNAGSRYLIDRDVTTVGRHPESHVFLDDVTVSRRHVEIVRGPHGIQVRDLGSLNGTYVNGDRVEDRMLASGDEVQVGRFKLLYGGAAGGDR